METNPFQPPSEHADGTAQVVTSNDSRGLKMYNPNQVGLASFIGSPMAGAWLIGSNFATIGRHGERTKTLLAGFVATLVVFALASALPDGFPGTVVALGYTFGLREAARRLQARDIAHVLVTGGTQHSAWRAAGVGFLCLLVVLVVVGGIVLLTTDLDVEN
jgi:hypothetical protein